MLLCLTALLASSEVLLAAPVQSIQDFLMQAGDDAAGWSVSLDDSHWKSIDLHDVPHEDSAVWLRAWVTLSSDHREEGKPIGIYMGAMASHTIWWDGEVVGRGGVVGDRPEEETPGPIEARYYIPDRLTDPGRHLLAIRTSAFHRNFQPGTDYWFVLVGDYERILDWSDAHARLAGVALSGILMVAVFGLMMFVQDTRDRSFLFLGLLCLAAALLLVAESWRSVFGYTYNWHFLRLVVVTCLAWLLNILLLVFLARRFALPGARWFVLAGALSATVPILVERSWDPKVLYGFAWVFSLSTLWCLFAAIRKLRGGALATLGLGSCTAILFWSPGEFVDRNLYLAMNLLLVCLMASHVLRVRAARMEREHALLKSARLEIELLKKHLQLHFLMNSLTALAEWLEEDPPLAARMIQSLADEFRILSEISHRQLIRMEEEVRLCQIHLDIMSHRKGRTYRMNLDSVDLAQFTPPAIFHTLVENAITHNPHTTDEVEFHLSEHVAGGERSYVFECPLVASTDSSARSEGPGLRSIRARLQESFGKKWKLESGPQGALWRTTIRIPAVS